MFSLTMKALMLAWPWLKRAIFGDRTVREVVWENKHLTIMGGLVLVMLWVFLALFTEHLALKAEAVVLRNQCVAMQQLAKLPPIVDE